ncbi:hypothetical protein, partial [Phaeobacter sp. SYSU ZJ3003]|uniref:hypothetical protein n=1 Tax=Phaeobacter sp. SYSU ZJ3003 TaxID=2109330 RepID=UPI00351BF7C3
MRIERFDLADSYEAECQISEEHQVGDIYHRRGNRVGSGATLTPVARFFVWRPDYSEGVNPHWRVDCYVKRHRLSGAPEKLGNVPIDVEKRFGRRCGFHGYAA